jgi:hypothetical protein
MENLMTLRQLTMLFSSVSREMFNTRDQSTGPVRKQTDLLRFEVVKMLKMSLGKKSK